MQKQKCNSFPFEFKTGNEILNNLTYMHDSLIRIHKLYERSDFQLSNQNNEISLRIKIFKN